MRSTCDRIRYALGFESIGLLMTGYADQRERADDLAEKIIDVVEKPFALPDIRKAVARALKHGIFKHTHTQRL